MNNLLSYRFSKCPLVLMLRTLCSACQQHKAPGIDGITPGSLRAAGPDISESLLQLIQ